MFGALCVQFCRQIIFQVSHVLKVAAKLKGYFYEWISRGFNSERGQIWLNWTAEITNNCSYTCKNSRQSDSTFHFHVSNQNFADQSFSFRFHLLFHSRILQNLSIAPHMKSEKIFPILTSKEIFPSSESFLKYSILRVISPWWKHLIVIIVFPSLYKDRKPSPHVVSKISTGSAKYFFSDSSADFTTILLSISEFTRAGSSEKSRSTVWTDIFTCFHGFLAKFYAEILNFQQSDGKN